jgi:hypothetical protein
LGEEIMGYIELKNKYLEKLKDTKDVLNEAVQYAKINVFTNEELKELAKLKEINSRYLDKLNSGEIEIAIVGMENTGKSTFANALIKLKEAFPTDSKRATFTSTKLRYGIEDRGVVEFFSKKEFDEIFREMLSQVKYPNVDIPFERFELETYKEYFERLKIEDKATYEFYSSKTNKDIIDILEGKDKILKYLDMNNKFFTKEDIENEKLKEFITNKYIARSVKKVEIFLSSLENMKELVIYDVPGFNSITEKHKEETREALKKADAIILIKNVIENSQITSEELDIFNSYDDSGLPLSEKLFVFGTKVDRANEKSDLANIDVLKKDLFQQLNVKEENIFIGSPYAYMQKIGLQDGNSSVKKMIELGLEQNINAVEDMKIAIKRFYENEAFNNIQKQININISSIKEILSKVIDTNIETDKLDNFRIIDNEIIIDYITKVDERLIEVLTNKKDELKKDIKENQYFSKILNEKIDTIVDEVEMKELENLNNLFVDTRNEFAVDKVNIEIRKKLFNIAKENFQNLITDIANDKFEEILSNLNKEILEKVLLLEVSNKYYQELQEKLSIFIGELTKDVAYNRTSFVYLIDRFSRDLMAILIDSAKGSPTRKAKFIEAQNEFLSLAFYYEETLSIDSIYNLSLIKRVLGLESIDDIESKLLEKYEIFKKFNELKEVLDLIKTKKIHFEKAVEIIDFVIKSFNEIDEENINLVKKRLKNEIEKVNLEEIDVLDDILSSVKQSTTKEELLEELNTDIKTLKDILKSAVLKAIGLEIAFTISVVKTIDKIINSKDKINKEFINQNFAKIKHEEISKIEENRAFLEEKQRVVKNIKELLKKI